MKVLTYSRYTKEVPFTIKNLSESFSDFIEDFTDIPDFDDKETLEDYLDNCEIEFSKEEIKQLPKLFNDWLKEDSYTMEALQTRHELVKAIKPLIDKYGENAVWYELDNLKNLNY